MNFSKSIAIVFLTASVFTSCKEAGNKPLAEENEIKTDKKEIVAAVKPETASFHIEGMTCAIGCAKTIEEKLTEMPGVQKASVDFDKKEATVNFDASLLTTEKISEEVESCADGQTYKVSNMKMKS